MKIERVIAREIFDSRGWPTIECELILEDGTFVTASVPSGISRSKYEALELRDGDKRMSGMGVSQAIENIESIIAPALINREPDLVTMDVHMLEIDGTDDKSKLGANAILAVSTAVLKAQAAIEGLEPYEMVAHLCGLESISVPLPMFNMINGGRHAHTQLQIQEFLLVPTNMSSFRTAMESACVVFHELEQILAKKGKNFGVGDEGGFVANFDDVTEAFDLLSEALDASKKKMQGSFVFGLDVAANQFYDAKKKKYKWNGKSVSSEQLIKVYEKLAKEYPIYSIEDGLSDEDWDGWIEMTKALNEKVQIVGDDVFATNAQRIWQGIEQGVGTAAIIKPNQIGTLTETLQAIKLCKEYTMNVIVSHRSGETNDTFLADLAVGVSAGHIKAGGFSRGERMAKYNQLLRIEDSLVLGMLGV
jgi:enolase